MDTGTEQQSEQAVEQSQAEAEASFAAGFARVNGDGPKADAEVKPKEGEQATPVKPAEAAAPEPTPEEKARAEAEREWEAVPKVVRDKLQQLETIPNQISKLAGHVGGFKNQLESVISTAKAAAEKRGDDVPTDRQVQQAMATPEAWARFEKDWPEMAEAINARLNGIAPQKAAPAVGMDAFRWQVSQDISQAVDVAEERALVRLRFPTWKQTVATPEFAAWFQKQSADVQSLAQSQIADDAIRMLDAYDQHTKSQAEAEAKRQQQQKRLAGAVTPTGSSAPPSPASISDEEALTRGFKRAHGR